MDASRATRHLLVDSGIREAELARRIGVAPQNLNTRLKAPQNWRVDDLGKIAAACGARFVCGYETAAGDFIEITPTANTPTT